MDPMTKQAIEDFVTYLDAQLKESKDYKQFGVGKWSLNNFKVTVHLLNQDNEVKIYFDEREILENKGHFSHLIGSALDQLSREVS